jgi:integrase
LGQAEKWGLVSRNVAKLVDVPRVKRVEINPYSPPEARAFVEAIKGDRLEALFYLALALGVRQGEALGLSWGDIDLDAQELTVRTALQRIDGEFRLVEPKSAASRRNLALADSVVEILKAHRTRQLEERLQSGSYWQDTALVFTTPTGGPLSDGHVRRRFYKILAGAGLRRQRFHDLRHACASLLLAQNVHPRVVMETLGHSTISLTMNTYSHVLPAAQREAASKIGALLEGSQPG